MTISTVAASAKARPMFMKKLTNLRRRAPSSTRSDYTKFVTEEHFPDQSSRQLDTIPTVPETPGRTYMYHHSINKSPLKFGKDGLERLSNSKRAADNVASGSDIGTEGLPTIALTESHNYESPSDYTAMRSSYTPGSVSYFPDQVARVSYVAAVVKPDLNGEYLKDLQGGMDLLAKRLAPMSFPGMIVFDVNTQVDGYFPAGKFSVCSKSCPFIFEYVSGVLTYHSIAPQL